MTLPAKKKLTWAQVANNARKKQASMLQGEDSPLSMSSVDNQVDQIKKLKIDEVIL